MLYLFAVIFGLGYGGSATVQSSLVADFFGLRAHGAVLGLTIFAITAGGALGSFLAGYIFDISGSYHWAFILCSILTSSGLLFSIFLKPVS
jgi:MFS family permease